MVITGCCYRSLLRRDKKSKNEEEKSRHIVVVHRLMTPRWLKQLNKAADCIFTISPCHSFWPTNNFEPLYVALIFPYLKHRPFQLKQTPKMFQMGRSLSKVFQEDKVDGGDISCKFVLSIGRLSTMSRSMVWKLLYFGEEPPFPLTLACDGDVSDRRDKGYKRKTETNEQVERKRCKSTRFNGS